MSKSLILGNGNVLVGLDSYGQVSDFYFPYVGLENHVGVKLQHRIGVFADNRFVWFSDPSWNIKTICSSETFSGEMRAINNDLGLELKFLNVVYNEKDIFVRKIIIKNLRQEKRQVKVFFIHEFKISETNRGDTAYYDPKHNVVIHYKGRRALLINAKSKDIGFDDYSIGNFNMDGKEGTHKDAENGNLSKNPIEHGMVDSAIGLTFELAGDEEILFYYWIIGARSIDEAHELNRYILEKHPEHLIETTQGFWHAWINKQPFDFCKLDKNIIDLFKQSLFIIRAHTDNHGAIIASGDSDMLQHGHDTYSYVWPRDGAISAMALDKAVDSNISRTFFKFCNNVISKDGYFMHKYLTDESLGSSWHPWIRDGKPELPIQEDETALVIYALWEHYEISKDLEFIESIYNSLIKKAADFMVNFIYEDTGLPYASYDLWEEKYGSSTFSSAAKYGALIAAGKFANLFGKFDDEKRYIDAAKKTKEAILKHLYNEKENYFYKMINVKDGQTVFDDTIDMSSIYGIYWFGILDPKDDRVKKAIKVVEDRLVIKTSIGGVPRYQGDTYYQTDGNTSNPWIITTLWLAKYYIAVAENESDLILAKKWIDWTVHHANSCGLLSEQINPHTGASLSATPLTWSHSEFTLTVMQYIEKLKELGICA